MLDNERVLLANRILSELQQSDGTFGIAYLQVKYQLGYVTATRIVEYFTECGYIEKGDFGSVTLVDSSGENISCKLNCRVISN